MQGRLLTVMLFLLGASAISGCSVGAPETNSAAASSALTPLPATPSAPAEEPTAAPTATAVPLPTGTPEPTETPWPTRVVDKDVQYNVYKIEDQAAAIRGLVVKKSVSELFITPQELHDYFAAHVDKGYSIEEAQQNEMEAWLMRLIKKRDVNLKERAVDVHTEGILGFYSPDIKELFVLGDTHNMTPDTRETLAHEFTHALQDQHFNLTAMIRQYSHDSDHRLAIRALIEGDATLSGLAYSYTYEKQVDNSTQKKQPANSTAQKQSEQEADGEGSYIGKTIYFPYIQGTLFVSELTKVAGFSAVNRTYQEPPVSSEQILHPDKYIKTPHDLPLPVALPPLTGTLGTGWTLLDEDTTGEWELRMALEETKASNPEEAAAGWGGGRYSYYGKADGNGLLFMHTRWDTEKDADEFEAGMREGLDRFAKEGTVWTEGGRYFALRRDGSHLFYIASTDRPALEAAWQAAK